MHIWINLLDNAIKFSPSKGTITMFLKQEQDSVKFILEDEGPGIEAVSYTQLFTQRQTGILCLLQNAFVEPQPRKLTVCIAMIGVFHIPLPFL